MFLFSVRAALDITLGERLNYVKTVIGTCDIVGAIIALYFCTL